MKKVCFFIFPVILAAAAFSETVYFLVSDFDPAYRKDSYILPLTDPVAIAHARDLVAYGPGVGQPLIVADIVCGADGINRNVVSSSKNQWLWHVVEFSGFGDMTIEILDGSPTMVNSDCQWWMTNTGGAIGFWSYTVVAELGQNPKPWLCNLNGDTAVNLKDLAVLSSRFMNACSSTNTFCNGADINQDGSVDAVDLEWLTESWLSPYAVPPVWYSAWNCPWQCHGDANCQASGLYRVTSVDLSPFTALYGKMPVQCWDILYNPAIDFDRDCDIDEADGEIIETWFMKPNVPGDCPTQP